MSNDKSLRVSHRYNRLPGSSFNLFAASVVVGMANNPAYLNPLVPLDQLSALQVDFEQKNLASKLGGSVAMALKNEARAALTDALRRQGSYVQGVAQNLSTLLSSGYVAASRNNAQTPLVKPWILKILNERPRSVAPACQAGGQCAKLSGANPDRQRPVAGGRIFQSGTAHGGGEPDTRHGLQYPCPCHRRQHRL